MITNSNTFDARLPFNRSCNFASSNTVQGYSYTVTQLHDDSGLTGTGLSISAGPGTELLCRVVELCVQHFVGHDIEEIMSRFGSIQKVLADDCNLPWPGTHKGILNLALAGITNAAWDLWAKKRGIPLWKLLLDLTPHQFLATLDLTNLEDVLNEKDVLHFLTSNLETRRFRQNLIHQGFPCHQTTISSQQSAGSEFSEKIKRHANDGNRAIKIEIKLMDIETGFREALTAREILGGSSIILVDAKQTWNPSAVFNVSRKIAEIKPFWISEPLHSDDIYNHQLLMRKIVPIDIAAGGNLPNRVAFKNYMTFNALSYVQIDALRVGGVSEYLVISLLAKKFNLKVVPHISDMGQLHQHLVLFNHIALNLDKLFLEYSPCLQHQFVHPIKLRDNRLITSQEAGSSCDLKAYMPKNRVCRS